MQIFSLTLKSIIVCIAIFNYTFNIKDENRSNGRSLILSQQNKNPETICDIVVPEEFERINAGYGSFAEYLRSLPVKQDNNTVNLFNGQPKGDQNAQYCVIEMDVGNRDLQQCADAVIRLRAEYLFKMEAFNKIHFNFTSGDTAKYIDYLNGYRAVVQGNNVSWLKKAEKNKSYKTFRKYLDLVFTYAGTYSLSKELLAVNNISDIQIGDVFIQTGQPYGHAVIVVDMAINKITGEKIFLLAQSYMPAQEIHILVNPMNNNLSPWYSVKIGNELQTPEWTFYKNNLKRFN